MTNTKTRGEAFMEWGRKPALTKKQGILVYGSIVLFIGAGDVYSASVDRKANPLILEKFLDAAAQGTLPQAQPARLSGLNFDQAIAPFRIGGKICVISIDRENLKAGYDPSAGGPMLCKNAPKAKPA